MMDTLLSSFQTTNRGLVCYQKSVSYLSKSQVFPRQCGCKQSVLSEVRNRQHCNKMSTVTWYVVGSKVVLYITRRFT